MRAPMREPRQWLHRPRQGRPRPLPRAWRQVALGVRAGLLRREPLEAREHRLQRSLEVQPAEAGQRREIGRAQERRRRAAAHDRDQRLAAAAEALLVDAVAPEQVEIEDAAPAAGLDGVREGDHAGAEALEIRLVAAGEEVGAVVGDADQIAGDERIALGERGAVAELGRNGSEAAELDLVDAWRRPWAYIFARLSATTRRRKASEGCGRSRRGRS